MLRASIETLYGESFFMRAAPMLMPWGTEYICVELVLRYSETSHRLGETFFCAIEDTVDRAFVKACGYIKAQMEG